MPFDMTLSMVRRYTADELEALWRQNFQYLVVTAISDADGRAHPAVADRLRSPAWCADWIDALDYAIATAETAVERMTYSADPRQHDQVKRLQRLRASQHAGRIQLKQMNAVGNQGVAAINRSRSAARFTKVILRSHFHEWFNERLLDETARRGLPRRPPSYGTHYRDGVHMVESMIEDGTLEYPTPDAVKRLIDLSDDDFRNVVAEDVADEEGRDERLRHPALLNDWMAALQDLQEMTWSHLELKGGPFQDLPQLDYAALTKACSTEVAVTLRRRRFYRSVIQRTNEWRRLRRHLVREAETRQAELDRPWTTVLNAITDEIPAVFPREYEAVRRALDPFGEPDPGCDFLSDAFHGKRRAFKDLMKKSLADGTWTRLL
jgi:hypothetical protein